MSKTAILDEQLDRETFPDLKHLLNGWFHQDYDIEGPDLETILPKFADACPLSGLLGTIEDIHRFVGLYGKNDATLHAAVERILEPEVILEGWDGMTTREWLLRAAELLTKELRSRRTENTV